MFCYRKMVENLLIFVYLFCPKDSTIDFAKNLITQECLVVESCPTRHWIAFLMLCKFVYNIRSHFTELILACSAYIQKNPIKYFLWFFFYQWKWKINISKSTKSHEKKHEVSIKICLKKEMTNDEKKLEKNIKILLKRQYHRKPDKISSEEQKQKVNEYRRNYYITHNK